MIYIHGAPYWVQIKLIQTPESGRVSRLNICRQRMQFYGNVRRSKYFGSQQTQLSG